MREGACGVGVQRLTRCLCLLLERTCAQWTTFGQGIQEMERKAGTAHVFAELSSAEYNAGERRRWAGWRAFATTIAHHLKPQFHTQPALPAFTVG